MFWKIQDRTEEKKITNKTKHNPVGLVASDNTQPGNDVDLFYDALEPTQGVQRSKDETSQHLPSDSATSTCASVSSQKFQTVVHRLAMHLHDNMALLR